MLRHPAAFAIFTGGLIGGAFDITYALVFSAYRGVAPTRILQSVASGLLGMSTYQGGMGTAALGLGLHFVIALLWAAIFYAASRKIPALARHPFVAGPIFGLIIYLVMNLVVLPLSAFPHPIRFVPIVALTGIAVHMLLIGLPIALATRRASAPA